MPYEELKEAVEEKFSSSASFLGSAQMAITFEGRTLSNDEQVEMVNIITESSDLDIVCIVETDEKKEEHFHKSLNQKLEELSANTGQFYKGNLRSGQVLNFETSIVIIGDVNVGAQVTSTGNVIILGSLNGNVFAGASGNENAFVVALDMNPVQIRIGDTIARAPDRQERNKNKETKIAFCEEGNIYIEPLGRDVIGDIRLS